MFLKGKYDLFIFVLFFLRGSEDPYKISDLLKGGVWRFNECLCSCVCPRVTVTVQWVFVLMCLSPSYRLIAGGRGFTPEPDHGVLKDTGSNRERNDGLLVLLRLWELPESSQDTWVTGEHNRFGDLRWCTSPDEDLLILDFWLCLVMFC